MGCLGAPHGLHGWLHLRSYTDPPENLLDYRPWYVGDEENRRLIDIEDVRPHTSGFLVKFADFDGRHAADGLRGRSIWVSRDTFPELADDEVLWHDLVGCQVYAGETYLGIVRQLLETGANDVLVVKGQGDDLLIPYADPYLQHVDITMRRITVQWDPKW